MGPPIATAPAPARGGEANDETGGTAPSAPAPASGAAPVDPARARLEEVFSPEISAMILEAAFGVAAVVTGEPDIWRATDDEIEPLAPALGRQLARIPVVRMVGPDNTEGGIVLLGIGVMVTRRLNEHAEREQAKRRERERALAAGDRVTDLADARAARAARTTSTPAPAPATELEGEDGSRVRAHFGMRA